MLVALDTSEGTCSGALVAPDGQPIAQFKEPIGRGHAEYILPRLQTLFAEAGVTFEAVTRIAVTTGPGSFTGVRVALSVGRGLGFALGVPVVGLSALAVLAAQAGHVGVVHALLMGRGGQAFHQAFEVSGPHQVPRPLTSGSALFADDIRRDMAARGGIAYGSGTGLLGAKETASSRETIDPHILGALALSLDPARYPPRPTYMRDADAAIAPPVFPTA